MTSCKSTVQNVSEFLSDNVSFQIVWLCGLNGSGKTTFLKNVLEVLSREKGESQKSSIGYLPTYLPRPDGMRVRDLLEILGSTKPFTPDESVPFSRETASLLDRYLQHLSTGEIKKVFLTASCRRHCQYQLWDEPFANLDLASANELQSWMMSQRSLRFICITHDRLSLESSANSRQFIFENFRPSLVPR